MPRLKLRSELALWYALLFALLLGISALAVFEVVQLRLQAESDDNLVDHMAGLWGYVRFNDGKPSLVFDPQNKFLTYFLHEATRYYQIYDAQTGALLLESEDSALMQLSLTPAQAGRLVNSPGIDTLSRAQEPLRFRSAVFLNNQRPYLVRVGVSVEQDLLTVAELRKVLLWLVPMATAIAVFGAWWMSERVLRPLRDLEQEAAAINIAQLDRRLPLRGTGDELDSLAAAFNHVLARLEKSVRQMRDFADFMAHELRTPMTVLRGDTQVELMRRDLPAWWRTHLESHLEEFGKLDRLIDRFLLAAKAETGEIQFKYRTFSLSDLARSLVETLEPVAEQKRISLRLTSEETAEVLADPDWVQQALLNLLDNALKFTAAEGEISVVVRNDHGVVVVEVADTGCGIGPEDLPHIFDRFYRPEDLSVGSRAPGGLGLSLTKRIVELHHGTISVKSAKNQGSTFTIVLPAARQANG
jgi:heavy metal sensor kinase